MKNTFLVIGHRVRQFVLVLWLVSLLSLAGLYLPGRQMSYAATVSSQGQEKTIQPFEYSEPAASREEAYEKAAKAARNPRQLEKAEAKEYDADKKVLEQEHPGPGLVEGAKELLKKVTNDK